MNETKQNNITESRKILQDKKIKFQEFNNGLHWRITLSQFNHPGHCDFWPSSGKFIHGDHQDQGINNLIGYLQGIKDQTGLPQAKDAVYYTIEELFEIAKRVRPQSLHNLVSSIHGAIYKKKGKK